MNRKGGKDKSKGRPRNLLAIDGGLYGLSGLPALVILEEMFERLKWDLKPKEELPLPCKMFDMIMASGRACIAALLIGKLQMNPSQAIDAYLKLEAVLSVGPAEDDDERDLNSEAFEDKFLEILKENGFDENSLMNPPKQDKDDANAKIIICTVNINSATKLHSIRSYTAKSAPAIPCTILQAACASIASPDRFLSVTIGEDDKKIVLVDAISGYANPAREMLLEAQRVYGEDAEVATIISIGAGKGASLSISGGKHENLAEKLSRVTSDCEDVHKELSGRLRRIPVYFRFNHDLKSQDMEDSSSVNSSMDAYFQQIETGKHLDDAVESIGARRNGGTFREINGRETVEYTLPPRPDVVSHFVGREDILEAMRETHYEEHSKTPYMPSVTVLSGVEGSGKTEIALEFAREFEEMFPGMPIYFLNARSEDSLKADFEKIIRFQGVAYRSKTYNDALIWLTSRAKKWCLILDGADDPSFNLFPYIPKFSSGHVIVTTRNPSYALLAPDDHRAVGGFSLAEATALVLGMTMHEATEKNQALVQEIVNKVGNLPLSLARYRKEQNIPISSHVSSGSGVYQEAMELQGKVLDH